MNRTSIAVVVFTLICFLPLSQAIEASSMNGVEILQAVWKGETVEYLDREILIGLHPDRTQADFEAELIPLDVEIVRLADRFGFLKVKSGSSDALFNLIAAIENLPSVRYAEPNMVDQMYVIPNDPMFNEQWHYHNTGQSPPGGTADSDIDAPEGWDVFTGSSAIMVGVLDSGIPMQGGQMSHPDLDDPTRYFAGIDISNSDNEPADDNGHGTHVSGTIAAETNNAVGVAGVSWNARIMAIKVFNQYGSGSHENFRDGCIYATDNGCKVINYSGGGSAGATKEHGVAYADTHGVVVCAAAGNSWQGSVSWPGAYSLQYSNVICVSATDHNDQSSPFSSIGPEVSISAPGGYGSPYDADDVISTFPNYEVQLNIDLGLPQDYSPLAGTSMATPHVAGFAALILGLNPTIAPDSVRQIMMNTSDDLGPIGFDNQFGWGRINIYNALSQIGAISISHTPLADTKETVDDYEVLCTIFSDTTLVPDSLLLRYQIASTWYVETLQATGGTDEFNAFIPAQSPGTEINYYLFAKNEGDDVDSTDTYSFRVIDYGVSMIPESDNKTGASEDTAWYELIVSNDGVYTDSYNISVGAHVWTVTVFDSTGTTPITVTPAMAMDETYKLMVQVEIPVSLYGEFDVVDITVTSSGDPVRQATSTLTTHSAGSPISFPVWEPFPVTTIDPGKWVITTGAVVNELGLAEPSDPYSLNLNGDPDGSDTLMSRAIDLSDIISAKLNYYYQQTGGGESPDAGDDLVVEFLDESSSWVSLMTHLGSDGDMTTFELVDITLPAEAYHAGFRLRFVSTGSSGAYDDWFVDDIRLDYPPEIDVSPTAFNFYLAPGDSTTDELNIANNGLGGLSYSLVIEQVVTPTTTFGRLLFSEEINPASYDYPEEWFASEIGKGQEDPYQGNDILYNAGGPDTYGYYWIDSDEAGGPQFDWVDIQSQGTEITGLSDDSFVGPFPIGFTFNYYGIDYTEYYVSSNGFIGFGPTDNYGTLNNTSLPTSGTPNTILAWCWDDLNPTDSDNPGAKVLYHSSGDSLVIQFVDYPEYSAAAGDVINAEIILQGDGTITYQYLTIAAGFDILGASVGIENEAGNDGLTVVYNASYLHDNLAVQFTAPYQWIDINPTVGTVEPSGIDILEVKISAAELEEGTYQANVIISSNEPDPLNNPWTVPVELIVSSEPQYICGDADGNDIVEVSDAVLLIEYVFIPGSPAPDPLEAGDVDCNDIVEISDAVHLLNYIFIPGSPEPCADC